MTEGKIAFIIVYEIALVKDSINTELPLTCQPATIAKSIGAFTSEFLANWNLESSLPTTAQNL
jgi:hypothetical protein